MEVLLEALWAYKYGRGPVDAAAAEEEGERAGGWMAWEGGAGSMTVVASGRDDSNIYTYEQYDDRLSRQLPQVGCCCRSGVGAVSEQVSV